MARPFAVGDRVLLVDAKRRRHLVTLPDGGEFHTHSGFVPHAEIVATAAEHFAFDPVERGSSPAERFVYRDGSGEFGVIASVTEPFCGSCDRMRLTAEGQLRNCLFALDHVDLRQLLRQGGTDDDLVAAVAGEIDRKWAGHAIGQVHFLRPSKSMSQLGG